MSQNSSEKIVPLARCWWKSTWSHFCRQLGSLTKLRRLLPYLPAASPCIFHRGWKLLATTPHSDYNAICNSQNSEAIKASFMDMKWGSNVQTMERYLLPKKKSAVRSSKDPKETQALTSTWQKLIWKDHAMWFQSLMFWKSKPWKH